MHLTFSRTLFLGACLTLVGCQQQASKTVFTGYAYNIDQPSPLQPERLFLQQPTDNSIIIKWRGAADVACVEHERNKPVCVDAKVTDANHKEATFKQLQADTAYSYSIGGYSDESLMFRTAPADGERPNDGKLRLWILGDSGTASEIGADGKDHHAGDAKAVMDGFVAYNKKQSDARIDLVLMLGDNAYVEGTDAQWQQAVFDLYRPLLSQSAIVPTIGNHEMGAETITVPKHGTFTWGGISTSSSPDSYWSTDNKTPRRTPYLDIFTLPTKAEAGGVSSGTEQYFAQDFGNIHIVSLDSQLTARDELQRQVMREWLINDLSSNNKDWTIVIFHHPPYTRGSHDSDTAAASLFGIDQPIIDMREEFTQIFEDYGVDMVYSGHSHTYERSYYLNGHRGDAASFDASRHAEVDSDGALVTGREGQNYQQISPGSEADDKVVYTVAGSAGKVAVVRPDYSEGQLDHPAHAIQPHDPELRHGLLELGSVVLEATEHELSAYFIDTKGAVLDDVTITR